MPEPRLRTVNKAVPPYPLNAFPRRFVEHFAEEIVYMLATKEAMSLEGDEWEHIFANCIGATWRPSNVGLDDVVLDNCCWSAKTVKSSLRDLGQQQKVRLISGRNSPTYSFGVNHIADADPNEIGKMVLDIWNERVSGIRQYFKFARTVVLVKSNDHQEYLIFENETIRYDADQFTFVWNKRGNLEGYSKVDHSHFFTWQPHGSQFTIIEDVPENRLHLRIQAPQLLDKASVLRAVQYNPSWITILED